MIHLGSCKPRLLILGGHPSERQNCFRDTQSPLLPPYVALLLCNEHFGVEVHQKFWLLSVLTG